jgi:hypothetical protein
LVTEYWWGWRELKDANKPQATQNVRKWGQKVVSTPINLKIAKKAFF